MSRTAEEWAIAATCEPLGLDENIPFACSWFAFFASANKVDIIKELMKEHTIYAAGYREAEFALSDGKQSVVYYK